MSVLMNSLREKIEHRWNIEGRHTFLYFYFGGHGIMVRSRLFAICNSRDKNQMKYPLETALREMANMCPGAYILAVLDACRREIPKEMQDSPKNSPKGNGGPKVPHSRALSFGSGADAAAALRGIGDCSTSDGEQLQNYKGNIVLVYACEPDKRSAAQSSVAGQVFKQFKSQADPVTGSFMLPDVLQHLQVGDNGEVIAKTSRKLRLQHFGWQSNSQDVQEKFKKMVFDMEKLLTDIQELPEETTWTLEMEQMFVMMKEAQSDQIVANGDNDSTYFGRYLNHKKHG